MVDVGLVIGETESGKSLELSSRVVQRAQMKLSAVILCILEGKVQDQPISQNPLSFLKGIGLQDVVSLTQMS